MDIKHQYSIVASDVPLEHDPLEEALDRLEASGYTEEAYQDVINMAIAQSVFLRIMTEDEGRAMFEGRQKWQEMKV
jgi:hypothetical protein